ncbi:MAG TPA: Lsr2 family protein [Streptosporangiaceae bacterium]|nr:Lsr2 family protein [Streptosporangiaceae bacterium]
MTRKIHVHLIDDLDASEASETVRFEVDGRPYEIDLSSHNAQKFRADIAPYIAHARRVVTYGRRRRASLGRARGVAPATRRGRVTPGRGRVTGATADEETIPGNAGSLSSRTGPGSDMHHMRLPGREADGKEPGPF